FDRELAQASQASAGSGDPLALLMIDVDRFKRVNDTHGHPAGDEVLKYVARVLKAAVARLGTVRPAIAARFGGEEFAVLLPGAAKEAAAKLAETIRIAVEMKPVATPRAEIPVTISVGLAVLPEHARTTSELIAAADSALYQAKESGRNRVCMPVAATV